MNAGDIVAYYDGKNYQQEKVESVSGDQITLSPKGELGARTVSAKDVLSLFDGKRDLPKDTRVLAKWHNADSRSYTSIFYPGTLTEEY